MHINRRELGRLGAGGAIWPRLARAQSDRKIGYCIVGLGRISMQHFMPATKKLAALAGNSNRQRPSR